MRLTLRTLLSYLDDTLEPAEARLMGEKVAESELAQELIERIKKVTRRRGLSAPPVSGDDGDAATDPNSVAEYLDNALAADQLEEIEQSALDSDAHLAEVATCHQILTLVLGEPAKIPPTARQHMYRLVKGKGSIPYRKPATSLNVAGLADPTPVAEDSTEADEALLLGLGGTRLSVPIVGVLVTLLLLIVVIWMALPAAKLAPTQGYVSVPLNRPAPIEPKAKKPEIDKGSPKVDTPPEDTKLAKKIKDDQETVTLPEVLPPPRVFVTKRMLAPPVDPDLERRAIGRFESKDSLLLQRKRSTDEWERAVPLKELYSNDSLMCLPGIRAEIKLESGVRLLLWGTLPEYHMIDVQDLLESRVTLHPPAGSIDADLTLQSGRIYISPPTPKGERFEPVTVRVRFKEEIWDVTLLDPDSEVSVELFGGYAEGVAFSPEPGGPSPTTEVYLALLKGRADVHYKFKEFLMLDAPVRIDWNSKTQEESAPEKIPERHLEWWSKAIKDNPGSVQMSAAASHYAGRLSKQDDARIDVMFYSAMQDKKENLARRLYAARCLQALDAIEYLADSLAEDMFHLRAAGIRSVRHWTGLAPDRDLKFFNVLTGKKAYEPAHATVVMQLLHPFSKQQYARQEIIATLFESMKHERPAIRELAYGHLLQSDSEGAREVGFIDVTAPENIRDVQLQKWKASWKKRFVDDK
ncbi:MAG: hypothetical protein K8T89_25255 [Planctomycetes bacterium]|nr:hypothetical protein [Planctomycetota bacterium]